MFNTLDRLLLIYFTEIDFAQQREVYGTYLLTSRCSSVYICSRPDDQTGYNSNEYMFRRSKKLSMKNYDFFINSSLRSIYLIPTQLLIRSAEKKIEDFRDPRKEKEIEINREQFETLTNYP